MNKTAYVSAMLPDAEFEADVVLVAPREFEVTRAQRTYREKNFTSFTELLNMGAFQADHIKRINEALGLEALAAYLQSAGLKVGVINCNVAPHSPQEIARKIVRSKARVVGISMIYRPQVGFGMDLLEALQIVPDLHVVMGGALASYMPRELLSRLRRLNAVVFGEAEITFLNYCVAVVGNSDTRSLPGIAWRDAQTIVMNPAAEPLDLATVQRPTRHTLEYLRTRGWPTRIASIYTSRGCLAKCTFCTGKDAYNVERKITYRYRDPVEVCDEIQYLHEAFGVKFVYINDDNFLGYGQKSHARVRAICNELIARRLGIQFATECRVDGIDLETLTRLKEAGMRQVLLGIESGSESVLKRWRKGSTVEQNHKAVAMCREAGVTLEPGFILFDAETSRAELADNLEFVRAARFDRIPFPTYLINRLSVYPGTEVEREWTEKGILAPSPIPAQRTACPSDRTWMASFKEGKVARDTPVRGGAEFVDDPKAVIAYFQRLEYACADPRTEIAWRGLRSGVEPVEMFLESRLPGIISVLSECRGDQLPPHVRAEVRELVHRAAKWRQGVGRLIVQMLEATIQSYDLADGIHQFRWLRSTLGRARRSLELQTLGMDTETFARRVVEIRRELMPMQASIVIPTGGKWTRLRRTLTSLVRQNIPAGLRFEVILVCDGVEPPAALQALFDQLALVAIRLPDARGRGAARNAGISAARGETIILLDDDMVVSPDFIVAHLEAQANRPALCHGPIRELPCLVGFDDLDMMTAKPGVMSQLAERRIRKVAEQVLLELEDVTTCAERFGSSSRLESDGMDAFKKGRRHVSWVAFAGANLSAPRKWFLTHPMDERTGVRWGLEDIALALQWSRNHRPLGVSEGALALHLSHHRENWHQNLQGNAMCLDFLPENLAGAVLDYLGSKVTIEELEGAFTEEEAGVRQQGAVVP